MRTAAEKRKAKEDEDARKRQAREDEMASKKQDACVLASTLMKRYPEPHDHGGVYNRSPCAH